MEVKGHTFCSSPSHWGENPGAYCIGWVFSRGFLNMVVRRKIPAPLESKESNHVGDIFCRISGTVSEFFQMKRVLP
jgi:hypothetical protein